MTGDGTVYAAQVLDIWMTVTGRPLSPKQRAAFLERVEVPQLITYLQRHGRTWLEAIARRCARGRGPRAELRLADWIMSARDYSSRSRTDASAAPPRRRLVRGLPPPQRYGDDT